MTDTLIEINTQLAELIIRFESALTALGGRGNDSDKIEKSSSKSGSVTLT